VSPDEKRRLRVSAGELAYLELGGADDPAVVFLHGFPTSSYLWRHVAPLLAPWMRVIVPDLLGAGDSDKPSDAPLGLEAQAGYVRELLDGLGIATFAVVGHGFGGGIAQRLALDGGAGAMVLVDSAAFDAWPGPPTREAQLQAPVSGDALAAGMIRTALELGIRHRERLTDEDIAEYRRPFRGEEASAACFRFLKALDGIGLVGIESELARLEIPTLVLWGEEDPFHPAELAERLGEALAMASVALLPGCSHFLPEEAPETIGPLIFEYLRSRYLGAPHTHAGGPVVVELGMRPPEEEGT
jgi:pimeloyl-ACP methyl ester carboxylesterase